MFTKLMRNWGFYENLYSIKAKVRNTLNLPINSHNCLRLLQPCLEMNQNPTKASLHLVYPLTNIQNNVLVLDCIDDQYSSWWNYSNSKGVVIRSYITLTTLLHLYKQASNMPNGAKLTSLFYSGSMRWPPLMHINYVTRLLIKLW